MIEADLLGGPSLYQAGGRPAEAMIVLSMPRLGSQESDHPGNMVCLATGYEQMTMMHRELILMD